MNARTRLLLLAGVAAVLLAGAVLVVVLPQFNRPLTLAGSVLDPPMQAGDFTLSDQHGRPFRLSDQEGRVIVLYFGYTSCPDECPLVLGQWKGARALLGERAGGARFVFVTVDPDVDTPGRLDQFLSGFDPSFVGLTGERPALEAAWQAYGVDEIKNAETGHVDHTSHVYVLDKSGLLRETYAGDMTPADLANDVRQLQDQP